MMSSSWKNLILVHADIADQEEQLLLSRNLNRL